MWGFSLILYQMLFESLCRKYNLCPRLPSLSYFFSNGIHFLKRETQRGRMDLGYTVPPPGRSQSALCRLCVIHPHHVPSVKGSNKFSVLLQWNPPLPQNLYIGPLTNSPLFQICGKYILSSHNKKWSFKKTPVVFCILYSGPSCCPRPDIMRGFPYKHMHSLPHYQHPTRSISDSWWSCTAVITTQSP